LRRGKGNLVEIVCEVIGPAVEGIVENERSMAQDIVVQSFVNKLWLGFRSNPLWFWGGERLMKRIMHRISGVTSETDWNGGQRGTTDFVIDGRVKANSIIEGNGLHPKRVEDCLSRRASVRRASEASRL
jgi:hypothetical protein